MISPATRTCFTRSPPAVAGVDLEAGDDAGDDAVLGGRVGPAPGVRGSGRTRAAGPTIASSTAISPSSQPPAAAQSMRTDVRGARAPPAAAPRRRRRGPCGRGPCGRARRGGPARRAARAGRTRGTRPRACPGAIADIGPWRRPRKDSASVHTLARVRLQHLERGLARGAASGSRCRGRRPTRSRSAPPPRAPSAWSRSRSAPARAIAPGPPSSAVLPAERARGEDEVREAARHHEAAVVRLLVEHDDAHAGPAARRPWRARLRGCR